VLLLKTSGCSTLDKRLRGFKSGHACEGRKVVGTECHYSVSLSTTAKTEKLAFYASELALAAQMGRYYQPSLSPP